jgi:hypothetical protein
VLDMGSHLCCSRRSCGWWRRRRAASCRSRRWSTA